MTEEHRSLLESLLPDQIRGYEGIKLASIIEFRQRVADALATIERLL